MSYARCDGEDGSAHTTEGDITAVSHLAREQIGRCGKLAAEEREKNSTFAPLLQATVQGYGGKKTWNVPTCTLHRLCYNVQYTTRLWQIGSLSAARVKQEIGEISLVQGLAT